MKARDTRTANVIRMLDTRVMERRTAKDFSGEVDDSLYIDVIAAYQKSMIKAKNEYDALGEKGRASAEELEFEIAFCAQYLPAALGEDEVRELVRKAIAELGATDVKMVGRVVGAVMKEHKGKVEANTIKQIATQELGGRGGS